MPLVRVVVRNEYGLGQPELYGHVDSEDPKPVLDGVAVAGLVGILRQLGDLAEFAAEVFHGLQEQVASITSRSHKLRVRVQNIEAALPQLEKAMLAQTSHIHFAYTAGSDWHIHIRSQQSQFMYNDLPRFIMDNYEECRYPPSLHLLDKFDIGGPGSCLKRYSDPTFFKRASDGNDENAGKVGRDKKARKSKKKKSWRNGQLLHSESMPNRSSRMQFTTSNLNGKTSSQSAFVFDRTSKSVLGTKSKSFDSRSTSNYNEFHFGSTRQPEEESAELLSYRLKVHNFNRPMHPEEEELEIIPSPRIKRLHSVDLNSTYLGEWQRVVDGDFPSSSFVKWDEKAEIFESKIRQDDGNSQEMLPTDSNLGTQEMRSAESVNEANILYDNDKIKAEIVECNVEQDGSDKSPEILATKSHLDVQEREFTDYVKAESSYISEPFPKSISGGDQPDEIASDTEDKFPEMLAINFHLDVQESGSFDYIIADRPYTSDPFPKSISGGDQPDGIEGDTDDKSPEMLVIDSHLNVQERGSVVIAGRPPVSEPLPKLISGGDQPDEIESDINDKSPEMLAIISYLDLQESGSVDYIIVGSPSVREPFPKLISGGDQPDEIESDTDNISPEMLAINSDLDVQDSGSVDPIKADSPYISEPFPKLIYGVDQLDEIKSDMYDKSPEMLAINAHLDVQDIGSVDHIKADGPYISEPFPKLISGGDQLDEIKSDTDAGSPEMLATNSHLDVQDIGSVDHIKVDSPYISEPFRKLISGGDQLGEIKSDTDAESPEMLAINSHLDVQESDSVDCIKVDGPYVSEAPTLISGGDQLDEIESDTDDYMDALNTIESESESDIDCQTKREVQKHFSSFEKDAMDERLHVFTVYPSDHLPFDSKQHTASCISPNQGISRHLPSGVSTEHEQLPETAGKSLDHGGLLVNFLESAENPVYWKAKSVSREPRPSVTEGCIGQAPRGDKIITNFPDVDILEIAGNTDCSNLESFRTCSSAGQSAQDSSENEIARMPVIDYCESSDNSGLIFASFSGEPSARVVDDICESTVNRDCSNFVSDGSIQLSPSLAVHSSQISSDNKTITCLPVANDCRSYADFGNLNFESVKESSSGSVCSSQVPSGDKMISRSPVDLCGSVCNLNFTKFESIRSDSSSASSAVCSTQVSGDNMIITSLLLVDKCASSDSVGCSTFESVCSEPSFSCSACGPQAPSGDNIVTTSVANICVSAGNPICLKFQSNSSDPSSLSSTISDPTIVDIHVSSGNPECSKFESESSVLSSSSSVVSSSEATSGSKIITSLYDSRETAEEYPVQSMMLWTNGGLLGLQPSKPPDWDVSHTARLESMTKVKDNTSPKNTINSLKDDGCKGEMDISVKGSKNTEKNLSSKSPVLENDKEESIPNMNSFMKISPACVDSKLECGMNEPSEISSKIMPRVEISDDPDVEITCTVAKQKNDADSFQFPGLSHEITANGFQSKVPLVHSDGSEPLGGHDRVAFQVSSEMNSTYQLDYGSLVNSPSSSPPLEHMKISFQPTFGFEAPKLQLKFPDKSECHKMVGDMFPSFQLVPEVITPPDESGSNSDDDTFCRSSPYMSDEDLSHHTDSNSEQWDSGETPRNMDHNLYDALCRISPLDMESVSNSLELEGGTAHKGMQGKSVSGSSCPGNGVELFHYGHLPELPSFDALSPLIQQEIENISSKVDTSRLQPPKVPAPVPPPPPPPQWQTVKSHFDEAESRQDDAFETKVLESSISQEPRHAPAKKRIFDEAVVLAPKSKGYLNLDFLTEPNHSSDGCGMDEKEDFLQQIRMRSFSLRPTAMAKSITSGPTTNTNVTAILEKANAIRQVVGSDWEDDDNWSDA